MTGKRIERRIWIEAPPPIVYRYFLDPARLARWQGRDAVVDERAGGSYRIGINDDDEVRGRFVQLVPHRRLVFTWALDSATQGGGPATTVEVTLAPHGTGTALRIVQTASDAVTEQGGDMSEVIVLYDRQASDGDELRCEWCGRPGEALPFHVQSPDGDVEFAEPILCGVCQGLTGYLHPHRPPEQEQLLASARQVVSRLLTERFVSEGRPRPTWARGPGWRWPPRSAAG